ncbi:MAG: hypothetical protein HYT37_04395 [Candidatus Sungbacteria bacterium]|nr:hypothetical protein [Candidatus Sungbacteria bacterium]
MGTLCIPKETKVGEGRVALIPQDVAIVHESGHRVYVEADAGKASGFSNADYYAAGAKITAPRNAWQKNTIVAKVKELQDNEFSLIQSNTVIFLFAHFGGNLAQENFFNAAEIRRIQAVPYEDLRDRSGRSPVLREMSMIAGELAAHIGCEYMRRDHGGPGLLPQDMAVQILGAGNAGMRAEHVLRSLGVKTIYQHDRYSRPSCFDASRKTIAELSKKADLLICCAFDRLFGAPKIITHAMAQGMRKSALIVDVAIDEGGNCDFSKATTPAHPIFPLSNGVRIYALPNLPGMVPRSSSPRLSNAALPYILAALELKKMRRKISIETIISETSKK